MGTAFVMIPVGQLPDVLTTEEGTRNVYRITLENGYSPAQLRKILLKTAVNAFFFKKVARFVSASILLAIDSSFAPTLALARYKLSVT